MSQATQNLLYLVTIVCFILALRFLSAPNGSVSFAGSMIAFGKLQELLSGRPITYPGQQVVNGLLAGAIVACGIALVFGYEHQWVLILLILGALAFGVLFVLPIGGAD